MGLGFDLKDGNLVKIIFFTRKNACSPGGSSPKRITIAHGFFIAVVVREVVNICNAM